MTLEEMKTVLIDQYCDYQEIKRGNKEENAVLDYKIKKTAVKLSLLEINTEELIFK